MLGIAAGILLAAVGSGQTDTVIQGASLEMVDGDAVVTLRAQGSWDPAQVDAQVENGLLFARVARARLERPRQTPNVRLRHVEERGRVDVAVKLPAAITCRTTPVVRSTPLGLSVLVHCPAHARAAAPAAAAAPVVTTQQAVAPVARSAAEAPTVVPAASILPQVSAAAPSPAQGNTWWMASGVVLVALAAAAWWLRRRRPLGAGAAIEVLQTCSLGPKRALLLARVADKTLLLSSSETGIQLLTQVDGRTTAVHAGAAAAQRSPANPPWAEGQAQALERASFERALEDVGEDELLRRKLALAGATPQGHA